jgi:adenylate cyclase class 2
MFRNLKRKMPHLNIEFKARCADLAPIRNYLHSNGARREGEDHQIDTYFNVPHGRLKLREGLLENNLIHYERTDGEGPKASMITLVPVQRGSPMKKALTDALGIKVVVDKRREIYWKDNVKIHLDQVEGLGKFVEVEAIDYEGNIGREKLQRQCDHYLRVFEIKSEDLVAGSYSDLLLEK